MSGGPDICHMSKTGQQVVYKIIGMTSPRFLSRSFTVDDAIIMVNLGTRNDELSAKFFHSVTPPGIS